jgi:hypothetical protein
VKGSFLLVLSAIVVAAALTATDATGQEPGRGGRGGGRGNAPAAPQLPVPRLPDGTVDLDGLWVGGGPVQDFEVQAKLKPGEIPLLPEARKLMDSRKPEDDPHAYCMPHGPVRVTPYPYRFVPTTTSTRGKIMFIIMESANNTYRQIFMDGRKHPEDPDPSWWGHSIGWWEKDTLVIDSVGFNGMWWFDRRGHPHTEKLHLIERWTRTSYNTLEREITIDDPGAYSRPWTTKFTATLQPANQELMEYVCIENNHYGVAGGWRQ